MVNVCCMMRIVCCLLFVVFCLLVCGICYFGLSFGVRRVSLFVVSCVFVACCLCGVRRSLLVVGCLLSVVW